MTNPLDNPDLWDSIVVAGRKSPGVCRFTRAPARAKKYTLTAAKGQEGAAAEHVATPPATFAVEITLGRIEAETDEFEQWDAWKGVLSGPSTAARSTVGTGSPDDAATAEYERARARARSTLTGPELAQRVAELDAQYAKLVSQAAKATALNASTLAVDIYHPLCAGLTPPITSARVLSWTEPVPRGDGGSVVTIEFEEHRAPVATAGGTVDGSRSGGFSPRTKGFTGPDPNQDLKDEVARLTAEYQSP